MPEKKIVDLPNLAQSEEEVTLPMPLSELPLQVRIEHEMEIVRAHHERVAKAIHVFWGHRDCVEYLQQLILSGGDGIGGNRIGFKREVLSALINLANWHEVK
jgi:hypothetical protein